MAFAERILPSASDLWVQASRDHKQRLLASVLLVLSGGNEIYVFEGVDWWCLFGLRPGGILKHPAAFAVDA